MKPTKASCFADCNNNLCYRKNKCIRYVEQPHDGVIKFENFANDEDWQKEYDCVWFVVKEEEDCKCDT